VSNYDIKIATACAHLFLFNHYTQVCALNICIQSHLCVRDVQLSALSLFCSYYRKQLGCTSTNFWSKLSDLSPAGSVSTTSIAEHLPAGQT